MMLADLGADVIRVDRPGGGALQVAPADRDILFRGRPNVSIDLKSPRGVELVLDLVERADILIEGFRPGVTERLGFGPDVCLERNPRLVYGRMTGWGQDGPLAHTAGHDINYIAVAGGLDPLGHADQPPTFPQNLLGDFGGGSLYLVAGVLAALTHARETGEGQVVDAAITDGVGAPHGHGHLDAAVRRVGRPARHQPAAAGAPFYDVYETSDGRWMSVGGLEPRFYAIMKDLLRRRAARPQRPERVAGAAQGAGRDVRAAHAG